MGETKLEPGTYTALANRLIYIPISAFTSSSRFFLGAFSRHNSGRSRAEAVDRWPTLLSNLAGTPVRCQQMILSEHSGRATLLSSRQLSVAAFAGLLAHVQV